jgi:excisionase family DNA binding protein
VNRRHYTTIAEAAEYLQISDRTVRRLIRDGEGLLRLIRCGVEGGVGLGKPTGSVGGRGHHVVKAMALCPLTRRVEHAGFDIQDVDHAFGADDLGDAHSFST